MDLTPLAPYYRGNYVLELPGGKHPGWYFIVLQFFRILYEEPHGAISVNKWILSGEQNPWKIAAMAPHASPDKFYYSENPGHLWSGEYVPLRGITGSIKTLFNELDYYLPNNRKIAVWEELTNRCTDPDSPRFFDITETNFKDMVELI